MSTAYEQLIEHVRETATLGATASLLGWDQETKMPARGVEFRSRQLAQLAGMLHERSVDPRIDDWLSACEADDALVSDAAADAAVNVRELRRAYDRETKLPADLVREIAQTSALSRAKWVEARKADDFSMFQPWLEKVVALEMRKAECYGWADDGEPWDALADSYEIGCTAAYVAGVFTPLRDRLVKLVADLMDNGTPPDNRFQSVKLPVDQQKRFVEFVAKQIGFDFDAGRLDESAHPFCSGIGPGDTRMTTRFHEDNIADALGSTMHESGHGIYDQGLVHDHFGTPMGSPIGLSVHESQSRTWENFVGRSRAFWRWCHPKLAEFFGSAVADLSLDDVYGSVNIVQPSLIRVEADEATYNLHIMVRFELERALLKGDLVVADLPAAWNEKYRDYLGIDVPSNAKGCMQDVHWSMGALGYFPTYTLGNLYAAQFFEAALDAIPDLYEQFAAGDFGALRDWLRGNIHEQGMRYLSDDLCRHVTGSTLSAEPLMRHLEGKFRPLYGLA